MPSGEFAPTLRSWDSLQELMAPTAGKLDGKGELKSGFSEYASLRVSRRELSYFLSFRVVSASLRDPLGAAMADARH
jgi:hypothetical protein